MFSIRDEWIESHKIVSIQTYFIFPTPIPYV